MGFAILGLGPFEFIIVAGIIIVLFFPAILPRLIRRMAQSFTTIRQMADEHLESGDKEEEKK